MTTPFLPYLTSPIITTERPASLLHDPIIDTPRKRSGLYDYDFLMMDMCESSGIMTAIQCLILPKKPCMDLGRGEEQLDSVLVFFLACERSADLILAKARVA